MGLWWWSRQRAWHSVPMNPLGDLHAAPDILFRMIFRFLRTSNIQRSRPLLGLPRSSHVKILCHFLHPACRGSRTVALLSRLRCCAFRWLVWRLASSFCLSIRAIWNRAGHIPNGLTLPGYLCISCGILGQRRQRPRGRRQRKRIDSIHRQSRVPRLVLVVGRLFCVLRLLSLDTDELTGGCRSRPGLFWRTISGVLCGGRR